MVYRYYSSNARETTLTASVNSSATTILVDNPVGYPVQTPFTILCELGTTNEEIMLVTGVAGEAWTVTRGYDGSTAIAHDPGASIVHGVTAIDFKDTADHIAATSGIHGLPPGAIIVDTISEQTLSNKTITNPEFSSPEVTGGTFTGGSFSGPTLITPTIASFVNAQHDHSDAANGGELGGGGGGGGFGVAYKRQGTGVANITRRTDGTQGTPLQMPSEIHNVGGLTWTVSNNNTRITLPANTDDAIWHISAGCGIGSIDTSLIFLVRHEDLGIIARSAVVDEFGLNIPVAFSASTDFQSDSGKQLSIELAAPDVDSSVDYFSAYIAIHRIA